MTITGLDKVIKSYGNAPKYLDGELNKALEKSLFTIERNVKTRTPVDTGRLRTSIGDESTGEGWRWVKKNIGRIGTRVEYAYHVEMTQMRHRVGEAHYFLNGVKASVDQINRYFVEAVKNVISKMTT
jgi:hypothetical protein